MQASILDKEKLPNIFALKAGMALRCLGAARGRSTDYVPHPNDSTILLTKNILDLSLIHTPGVKGVHYKGKISPVFAAVSPATEGDAFDKINEDVLELSAPQFYRRLFQEKSDVRDALVGARHYHHALKGVWNDLLKSKIHTQTPDFSVHSRFGSEASYEYRLIDRLHTDNREVVLLAPIINKGARYITGVASADEAREIIRHQRLPDHCSWEQLEPGDILVMKEDRYPGNMGGDSLVHQASALKEGEYRISFLYE